MQPNPQTRQSPAATGLHVAQANHLERQSTAWTSSRLAVRTSDPVDLILSKLDNVRQYGEAWRSNCPCGHAHAKGSLRIATGDDGRVLLHCFVGCDAADVAAAAGLSLADLFPKPVTRMTPEERRRARNRAREADWAAALGVLAPEATVCEVALTMIERGEPLTPDDIERTRLAIARIHHAREVLL